MTVIDLIIKLQQLPQNMEVLMDLTGEKSTMMRFHEITYVDEVSTGVDNNKFIVISPYDYSEEGEENNKLN